MRLDWIQRQQTSRKREIKRMELNYIELTPEQIALTSNVRFGLKKPKVAALAEAIKEAGRVKVNLVVEPLEQEGPNGEMYCLREGNYRHAAVALLRKAGANIVLPCQIEEPLTGVDRLKSQISENWDREDMSPMDMAISIKQLLDAGVKKVDIRPIFSRPGGRKGNSAASAMQPLSNSMLNIYLSFLDFDKKFQNFIHEGRIGVLDAYKTRKRDKSEWPAALAAAEAKALEADKAGEALEAQFLAEEQKALEAEAKAKADKEALVAAEKVAISAKEEAAKKLNDAAEAFKLVGQTQDKDQKKVAEERFKVLEGEAKKLDKDANKFQTEADKLKAKVEGAAKLAAERAAKLAQARKDAAAKAGTGKLKVNDAAEALAGGKVKLKGPEIVALLNQMALPGSFPKVSKIFEAVIRCMKPEAK